MKIVIYIKDGADCKKWDSLSDKNKKELGTKLNEQGMEVLGYKKVR